ERRPSVRACTCWCADNCRSLYNRSSPEIQIRGAWRGSEGPRVREAGRMLSVIVPTYNEREGLPELVERLAATFAQEGLEAEILIVDDGSPDGTAALADELAARYPVRVLRRPGKAGLASAVLDGMRIVRGDLIGVMDADLSHPPDALLPMVRALEHDGVDLAVGSRYVPGGGMEDWPWLRQFVSAVANRLTTALT